MEFQSPKAPVEADRYDKLFSKVCSIKKIIILKISGNQISSRLLSFNRADALLMLPQGSDSKKVVESGEFLEAILLSA